MREFGGWHEYRNAPLIVVEEQKCVWIGERQADYERAQEEKRQIEAAQRSR